MARHQRSTIAEKTPGPVHPEVAAFFEPASETVTYVVREQGGVHCAIIDPLFEPVAGKATPATHVADEVIAYVRGNDLEVDWILETHTYADHLSAAHYLKRWVGGAIAIAPRIPAALGGLGCVADRPSALAAAPAPGVTPFDRLFGNGDRFRIGALEGTVLRPADPPAPGSTTSYVIGDCAFVDDSLEATDPRAPSIRELLALPEGARLYACHDHRRQKPGMTG